MATPIPAPRIAVATRQGTSPINNGDAGAVFTCQDGTTAGAVIDIINHPPTAPAVARLLAETAARIAAQRGGLAGLLSAGLLVADPGRGEVPEPNGVGVVAVMHPDHRTVISWIGDSHAFGWDGERLHRYTTPHTLGENLRRYGAPWDTIAASVDHVVTTSLAHAVPATVMTVTSSDPLIILASDGIDTIPHNELVSLVARHAADPQALADAIVAAAPVVDDYRDDTTVVILAAPTSHPAATTEAAE